jgi:hypothetical protein
MAIHNELAAGNLRARGGHALGGVRGEQVVTEPPMKERRLRRFARLASRLTTISSNDVLSGSGSS